MRLVRQLTTGLDILFERSLIHRDIKPQNIMLKGSSFDDYQVKIGDFGLSRRLPLPVYETTQSVGTPLYMAPEIPERKPFKIDVDVWALGCLVYSLFVGRPPFDAKNFGMLASMHTEGNYSYPVGCDIPVEAISFVDRCLRFEPEAREKVYLLHQDH